MKARYSEVIKERADKIRAIIKSKGFKYPEMSDADLSYDYWDTDIDTMIYNLEMDSGELI